MCALVVCGDLKRLDANTGIDGGERRALGRTRLRQDGLARDALLEQQLGRLHARIGMEPIDEDVAGRPRSRAPRATCPGDARRTRGRRPDGRSRADPVRRLRHRLRAAGSRSPRRTRTRPSNPSRASRSKFAAAAAGSTRLASAVAYGAITSSSASPRLRPKPGHAERTVLVVAGAVRERIRRFRDAPRHAARTAVLDLAPHAGAAALIEQRARETFASAAAASGTRTSCRPTTSSVARPWTLVTRRPR